MLRIKGLTRILRSSWVLAVVALLVVLAGALAQQPRAQAESGNWNNVLMVYTTDVKGKIEPCG